MRRILSGLTVAALLALPQLVMAQTREVTGRVTIAGTELPIADATVSIVGTNEMTRTSPNGTFRLNAPAGPVTVAARAIGYRRVTTAITASQSTVNFALEKDVLELEGVVVTGAATTVERRSATTAVAPCVGRGARRRWPSPTIENALTGKITGVNLQSNSGAPGGGIQMQIRGNNTILGASIRSTWWTA